MRQLVAAVITAVVVVACASPAPATPGSTPAGAPATPSFTERAAATTSSTAELAEVLPTPSGTSQVVRDNGAGFTFDRPASWAVWRPNDHSPMVGGPLLYVSTDPLLPTCAVAPAGLPNPPEASGSACDWPLDALRPDGVLAIWATSRILQPLPTAGMVLKVNGAETRWEVTMPGACSAVRADETVTVAVPIGQPTPLSNIAFVACLRGPDLATSEAAVRALLESAHLGP